MHILLHAALTQGRSELMLSHNCSKNDWDDQDTNANNYSKMGLVADANAGFGRNQKEDVMLAKLEQCPALAEDGVNLDDGETR